MLLTDCGCNNPCSNCSQVVPLPCTNDKCRKTLETTKIAQLVWLQGLDANLCERFQSLADAVGLKDCAGNRVDISTPVVLCSDFKSQLCAALLGLVNGGVGVAGTTQFVSPDCKVYTLPTGSSPGTETANTVTDTSTIDFSCTGTLCRNISGVVKVSPDAGNTLVINSNGLFVPATPSPATACQQLQAFSVGADVTAGTVLIGSDCQKHVFPGIPSPGFTVTDTSSVDLVLSGTNLQANVILDPTSIGRITGNGLQITCVDVLSCAVPVTVLDTLSVDLSLLGQQISADVKIDSDPINALELRAGGLFVNVCAALVAGNPPVPAVVSSTVLVGADCNRYTIPPQVPITGINTTTANTTVTGTQVQVDVNVQPGANLLTIGPQGLQVQCEDVQDCIFNTANNFWTYNDLGNSVSFNPSSDVGNQITTGTDGRPLVAASIFTVADTQCIHLILAGNVLSATPIISPQAGNGLTCLLDGLYSSTTVDVNITGQSTFCMNIGVTESTPNNFTINATPIISPAAGNALTCTATGLYATGSSVAVTDTSCIDLSVVQSPVGVFTVSAAPILNPSACQALTCTPTGLLVVDHTSNGAMTADSVVINQPFIQGQTVTSSLITLNISNPSTCRSAVLSFSILSPAYCLTGPNPLLTQFELLVAFNLPGANVSAESVYSCAYMNKNGDSSPAMERSYTYTVPPSFVGTVTARVRITQITGNLLNAQATAPILRYHLTTI